VLAALDDAALPSTVWSWVRSEAFFNALGVSVVPGPLVPKSKQPFDSVHLSRSFKDVFGGE
jgi:hypothetical protein